MVFCEGPCKNWYHLSCVGVDELAEVEGDVAWECESCSILGELEKEFG